MTQPIDQSPVVPSKVVVRFPGRRCSGAVSGTVPDYYVKTITTSAAGVTAAGFPSTKTFHEYALALFTVGGGTPTNQTALDALALRTTKDYYNWLGRSFDRLYSGVLNVDPVGYYEAVAIDYTLDEKGEPAVTTRISTSAYNDKPEELMHHDPANSACTDANNGGVPVGGEPCVLYYGPPASCVSNHVTLTRYRACVIDGRLVARYVSTDTF